MRHVESLLPVPEPAASTLEDEVLTIGSPGKSSPLLFMANLIYLFPIDSICSLLQIICNQIPDVTLVHLSTFQCISLIDKIFFLKKENVTTIPFLHLENINISKPIT